MHESTGLPVDFLQLHESQADDKIVFLCSLLPSVSKADRENTSTSSRALRIDGTQTL